MSSSRLPWSESLAACCWLAAGIYLLFHLNSDFGRLAERVTRAIEVDPQWPFFHRIIAYLSLLAMALRRRWLRPTVQGTLLQAAIDVGVILNAPRAPQRLKGGASSSC